MEDSVIELVFPFKGYNTFWGFCKQPQLTTPIILNCRAKDSSEEMKRGGQRPGKKKAVATVFTANRAILKIIQVGTTYINPES